MKSPRDIDMELVEAYLARRALDYLVGFNLSPVLWRKLPGSRSAGRVQSVALRLIVEREMEIEAFKPREYWSVKGGPDDAQGRRVRGPAGHPGWQETRPIRPRERGGCGPCSRRSYLRRPEGRLCRGETPKPGTPPRPS